MATDACALIYLNDSAASSYVWPRKNILINVCHTRSAEREGEKVSMELIDFVEIGNFFCGKSFLDAKIIFFDSQKIIFN